MMFRQMYDDVGFPWSNMAVASRSCVSSVSMYAMREPWTLTYRVVKVLRADIPRSVGLTDIVIMGLGGYWYVKGCRLSMDDIPTIGE